VPDPVLVETVVLDGMWRVPVDEVPQQLARADMPEPDPHGFARREPREQEEAIGAVAGEPLEARLPAGPGILNPAAVSAPWRSA
jgi:hypothetical protein